MNAQTHMLARNIFFWLAFSLVPVFLSAQIPKLVPFEEKKADRIEELALLLDDKPAGFGLPYHNREAWTNVQNTIDYKQLLENAEKILATEMPDWNDDLYLEFSVNGVRPPGEKMLRDRKSRLSPLVWAECIENKGRFVSKIESMLQELISHRSWILPAHDTYLNVFYGRRHEVDLAAAAFAHELAMTLYFLDDKLSQHVKQEVMDSMYVRIFNPAKEALHTGTGYTFGWYNNTNNWNAVCLAGVTSAALTIIPDKKERAFFLAAAEYYSQNSVIGYTDDGYCSEGLGYFNYGFLHYLILREQLWQRTKGKIDLFSDPKMKNIAMYGINIEIMNGVYPVFSDCRVGTVVSPFILWYCNHNLGLGLSQYQDIDKSDISSPIVTAMTLFSGSVTANRVNAGTTSSLQGKLPLRHYFDQAGVLICRPTEASTGTIGIALKGGHNAEHHNHNDVGSYCLIMGNEHIAGDAGGPYHYSKEMWTDKRYTYQSVASYGHPVPVIGDRTQKAGREYSAEVSNTSFTDAQDQISLDISKAYDLKSGEKLIRNFIYDRTGKGTLQIEDIFQMDTAMPFESALTTLGKWEKIDDNTILITGKENAIRVRVEVPQGNTFSVISEEIQENGPKYFRLAVRLDKNLSEGFIRFHFLPGR